MDEFRVALMVTRIIAVLLIILGGSWFFACSLAAANAWVFTGTLRDPPSFRLVWSTYAMVDIVAGLVMARFAHQIAKFETKL
jgi:hypothetical protein